jgi:hypothetical protein
VVNDIRRVIRYADRNRSAGGSVYLKPGCAHASAGPCRYTFKFLNQYPFFRIVERCIRRQVAASSRSM